MTSVGDEIDAHLLGRNRSRAVDHTQQNRMTLEAADDQVPRAPHLANPGDLDLTVPRRLDVLERLGMPDGEAHVTVLNPVAEKPERRCVGEADDAPFDDQRWLVDRIDQGTPG